MKKRTREISIYVSKSQWLILQKIAENQHMTLPELAYRCTFDNYHSHRVRIRGDDIYVFMELIDTCTNNLDAFIMSAESVYSHLTEQTGTLTEIMEGVREKASHFYDSLEKIRSRTAEYVIQRMSEAQNCYFNNLPKDRERKSIHFWISEYDNQNLIKVCKNAAISLSGYIREHIITQCILNPACIDFPSIEDVLRGLKVCASATAVVSCEVKSRMIVQKDVDLMKDILTKMMVFLDENIPDFDQNKLKMEANRIARGSGTFLNQL